MKGKEKCFPLWSSLKIHAVGNIEVVACFLFGSEVRRFNGESQFLLFHICSFFLFDLCKKLKVGSWCLLQAAWGDMELCSQVADQFNPHTKDTARHWRVGLHRFCCSCWQACSCSMPWQKVTPCPRTLTWGWGSACQLSDHTMVCIWSPMGWVRWPGPGFLLL